MKNKLILLLCLSLLIMACKKTKVVPNDTTIKGTWELRATRNGNIIPATYAPGNGHLLSFGNTTFAEYNAGAIVDKGSYKRSIDTSTQYTIHSYYNNITYNYNNNTYTNRVILQKDTLVLIPVIPDISTGFYVKTSSDSLSY
jgi:hypothetical protein